MHRQWSVPCTGLTDHCGNLPAGARECGVLPSRETGTYKVLPVQRYFLYSLLPTLLRPRPTVGGTKRCCDPSICLPVCLSRFLFLSRSLDGGMRASPLQTQSKGGSMLGYARVQSECYHQGGGAYRFAVRHLKLLLLLTCYCQQLQSMFSDGLRTNRE